ncbi:NinX [Vibrio phage 1.088.O._10N.261.46.A1]|nr:NinX [Vibrio phage 1.088.O._10N.261.46.A1]
MDTNYNEWSDLQVVTEVAKRRGLLVMPEDGSGYSHDYRAKYPSTIWVAKHEFGNQIEPWEQFNCVKCPNDVWPIIVENGISIVCDDEGYYAIPPISHFAAGGSSGRFDFDSEYAIFGHESLRAAMICFLKLKDETND